MKDANNIHFLYYSNESHKFKLIYYGRTELTYSIPETILDEWIAEGIIIL
jgi:hypothetical protein